MGPYFEDVFNSTFVGGVVFGKPARFLAGTTTATTPLTPGASTTIPALGTLFTEVPTQTQTFVAPAQVSGKTIRFIFTTSGTTSYTLTFGTGFKSQGTLATGTVSGKVFALEFVSDGTNYNEVARTTAM